MNRVRINLRLGRERDHLHLKHVLDDIEMDLLLRRIWFIFNRRRGLRIVYICVFDCVFAHLLKSNVLCLDNDHGHDNVETP